MNSTMLVEFIIPFFFKPIFSYDFKKKTNLFFFYFLTRYLEDSNIVFYIGPIIIFTLLRFTYF
jgi:hypothetical protein